MYAAEDEILRKQSFVSCWRYGGEESAVFWDAYIDDGNGVVVETTLDTLSSAMERAHREVLIGKVNYREYKGERRAVRSKWRRPGVPQAYCLRG